MNLSKAPTALLICGGVGFLAVVAAYVVLAVTGHSDQFDGLFTAVLTLLGVLGLGGHVERRTQQQNAQLDKITEQTNGVLTSRIEAGADKAVRGIFAELGYPIQREQPEQYNTPEGTELP